MLTIWGVERRLFFMAIVIGAATFNFFGSLLGGLLMFAALYGFARWASATDPEILRIVFSASKFRVRYDPAKPMGLLFHREGLRGRTIRKERA